MNRRCNFRITCLAAATCLLFSLSLASGQPSTSVSGLADLQSVLTQQNVKLNQFNNLPMKRQAEITQVMLNRGTALIKGLQKPEAEKLALMKQMEPMKAKLGANLLVNAALKQMNIPFNTHPSMLTKAQKNTFCSLLEKNLLAVSPAEGKLEYQKAVTAAMAKVGTLLETMKPQAQVSKPMTMMPLPGVPMPMVSWFDDLLCTLGLAKKEKKENGDTEYTYNDGSKKIEHKDGSITMIGKDGKTVTEYEGGFWDQIATAITVCDATYMKYEKQIDRVTTVIGWAITVLL